MIIGLKIAQGFGATTTYSKTQGGDLKVGVDATGPGAPVQAVPEVKLMVTKKDNESFKASSDCVFAYQVVRIYSKRNDKVSEEGHNRGALMNREREREKHGLEEFDDDWETGEVSGALEDLLAVVEKIAYNKVSEV